MCSLAPRATQPQGQALCAVWGVRLRTLHSLHFPAGFKRPVVILGPVADIAMKRLTTEMPEQFEIAGETRGTAAGVRIQVTRTQGCPHPPTWAQPGIINQSGPSESLATVPAVLLEPGKHCFLLAESCPGFSLYFYNFVSLLL